MRVKSMDGSLVFDRGKFIVVPPNRTRVLFESLRLRLRMGGAMDGCAIVEPIQIDLRARHAFCRRFSDHAPDKSVRGRTRRIKRPPKRATPAQRLNATPKEVPRSRIAPIRTVMPAPALMLTMFMIP